MLPFKFAASQAICINLHKNLRTKVHNCCANIYFNQQCLKQGKRWDPKVCTLSDNAIVNIGLRMTKF